MALLVATLCIGMPHEVHIVVAALLRHFLAEPRRAGETLLHVGKLDFGDDEPLVLAVKLVDFPLDSRVRHPMAGLLDDRLLGRRFEQRARIVQWNRIFVFVAYRLEAAALDVEPRFAVADAHPHRNASRSRDVALAHEATPSHEAAPSVAREQEFAFDFLGHEWRSSAIEYRHDLDVMGVRKHVENTSRREPGALRLREPAGIARRRPRVAGHIDDSPRSPRS